MILDALRRLAVAASLVAGPALGAPAALAPSAAPTPSAAPIVMEAPPSFAYPGQANATWARSIFLRGKSPTTGAAITASDIDDFARVATANHLRYAYLFSGPFQLDGSLPEFVYSKAAAASLARLRRLAPNVVFLPWVGGIENRSLHVEDPAWRAKAIAATKRLVDQQHFPGVHLDVEYLLAAGEAKSPAERAARASAERAYLDGVQKLHTELRAALPGAFISAVLVSTAPQTRPWKLKYQLDDATLVAREVDQLSFLFYDTQIHDAAVYDAAMDAQLRDFATIRRTLGAKTPQLLLAVGTFVNEPALRHFRDLALENLPSTLAMLRRKIAAAPKEPRLVDGLAVYCEWETDEAEWKQLRDGWTEVP